MTALVKQYLWALDLSGVILVAFFAAKITTVHLGRILEGKPRSVERVPTMVQSPTTTEKTVEISDYKMILDRNIFDSSEVPVDEAAIAAAQQQTVPTGEAVKTSLGIKVLGVLVVGSGEDHRSSATVQGVGTNAAVDVYAVGDVNGFAPNTKLTRVKPDRIEFIHGGKPEYALLEDVMGASIFGPPPSLTPGEELAALTPTEPSALIRQAGENKFVIDAKEVQNALSNLDVLYTDIRAVPNFAGGKVVGMKILSVKQGSIFDKLGLQRGDILEKINGIEMDVKRGFDIFNQLKDEKKLTLDLVRLGQKQTFEYEIR